MFRLALARLAFLWGGPLAIALHVVVSRSGSTGMRAAGMFLAVAYLLVFTWLGHALCPRCGGAFFGSFAGEVWGPWRSFRRAPRCAACNTGLR